MGSPAFTNALIDKSSGDRRGATVVCADILTKGVAGRVNSCRNPSSTRDTMEKKRARVPSPPSKLSQITHRGALKQDSVQIFRAARPTNKAQIFRPSSMPQHLGTI